MIVKITSSAILGIESWPVDVEVDISRGLPQFFTVGLPDVSVKESKDRIKAAIQNSGYTFPGNRVTINLAPADIKKEGTGYDLPIAAGILAAQGVITSDRLSEYLFIGELSLDGSVKSVNGVLLAAIQAAQMGLRGIILPRDNAAEASMVESIEIIAVDYLHDVVEFLNGAREHLSLETGAPRPFSRDVRYPFDFSEVNGQKIRPSGRWRWRRTAGTTSLWSALRDPARPCWRSACSRFFPIFPLKRPWKRRRFTRWPVFSAREKRFWQHAPFARLTTPYRTRDWWAEGAFPGPAKSASPLNGVLFLDERTRNSREMSWRCCGNLWRTAPSPYRALWRP